MYTLIIYYFEYFREKSKKRWGPYLCSLGEPPQTISSAKNPHPHRYRAERKQTY